MPSSLLPLSLRTSDAQLQRHDANAAHETCRKKNVAKIYGHTAKPSIWKTFLVASLSLTSFVILTASIGKLISLARLRPLEAHPKFIPQSCWEENEVNVKNQKIITQGNLYFCPKMDLDRAESVAHLWAMKTLSRKDVQDSFYDDQQCPYGSPGYFPMDQSLLLSSLRRNNFKEIGDYLLNPKFDRELNTFNENTPDHDNKFTRYKLIKYALHGDLDISKLLPGSAFSEDPTMIKLLKSLNGIRLAKPGDKDIALVLISSPAADSNGAFALHSLIKTTHNFWKTISKKYPIYFAEVLTAHEVYSTAEKIKSTIGNIKIIQLAGHGTENGVTLSRDMVFRGNSDLPIDKDGVVILQSCSGGKGGAGNPDNIVNKLAQKNLGVIVLGLTKDAGPTINVLDIDQRIFTFTQNGEDITYRAKASTTPFPFPSLSEILKLACSPFGYILLSLSVSSVRLLLNKIKGAQSQKEASLISDIIKKETINDGKPLPLPQITCKTNVS